MKSAWLKFTEVVAPCQESAQAMGLKDEEVMKDIMAEVPRRGRNK
jgi:hypothetical protein